MAEPLDVEKVAYDERLSYEQRILDAEMQAVQLERALRATPIPGFNEPMRRFRKRSDAWLAENQHLLNPSNERSG